MPPAQTRVETQQKPRALDAVGLACSNRPGMGTGGAGRLVACAAAWGAILISVLCARTHRELASAAASRTYSAHLLHNITAAPIFVRARPGLTLLFSSTPAARPRMRPTTAQ